MEEKDVQGGKKSNVRAWMVQAPERCILSKGELHGYVGTLQIKEQSGNDGGNGQ